MNDDSDATLDLVAITSMSSGDVVLSDLNLYKFNGTGFTKKSVWLNQPLSDVLRGNGKNILFQDSVLNRASNLNATPQISGLGKTVVRVSGESLISLKPLTLDDYVFLSGNDLITTKGEIILKDAIFTGINKAEVGDVNGDGQNDAVVTSLYNQQKNGLFVWYSGNPKVSMGGAYIPDIFGGATLNTWLDVADIDGDQDGDVAIAVRSSDGGGAVFLFKNNSGSWITHTLSTSVKPNGVKIVDFNNDSKQDIAISGFPSTVFLQQRPPLNHCGRCGDGFINPWEGCDDGNNIDTDSCKNTCESINSSSSSSSSSGGGIPACAGTQYAFTVKEVSSSDLGSSLKPDQALGTPGDNTHCNDINLCNQKDNFCNCTNVWSPSFNSSGTSQYITLGLNGLYNANKLTVYEGGAFGSVKKITVYDDTNKSKVILNLPRTATRTNCTNRSTAFNLQDVPFGISKIRIDTQNKFQEGIDAIKLEGCTQEVNSHVCKVESDRFLTREGGCKDNLTGQVWSRPFTTTWNNASGVCNVLNINQHGGVTGWRAPTRQELRKIAFNEDANFHLNIDSSKFYWSSEEASDINISNAFGIIFDQGGESHTAKSNENYVVCVRDTNLPAGSTQGHLCLKDDLRYKSQEGGCKDIISNTVWSIPSRGKWSQAASYCSSLNQRKEGGVIDWRVPTTNELLEIHNHDAKSYFNSNSNSFVYWSNVTDPTNTQRALTLNLSISNTTPISVDKNTVQDIVCVRNAAILTQSCSFKYANYAAASTYAGERWHSREAVGKENGNSWSQGDNIDINYMSDSVDSSSFSYLNTTFDEVSIANKITIHITPYSNIQYRIANVYVYDEQGNPTTYGPFETCANCYSGSSFEIPIKPQYVSRVKVAVRKRPSGSSSNSTDIDAIKVSCSNEAIPAVLKDIKIPSPIDPSNLSLADINKDNLPDIIFSGYSGSGTTQHIYLLLNTGNYIFASPQLITSSAVGNAFGLGDVNQDGNLDIVYQKPSYDIAILYGNGAGIFSNEKKFTQPTFLTSAIVVKDLDFDSYPEIIFNNIYNTNSNNLIVLKNENNLNYSRILFSVTGKPSTIKVLDIDNDGDTDILTANSLTNKISVLKSLVNNLAFEVSYYNNINLFGGINNFDVGDINNDGKLDIVTANSSDDVTLFIGDGNSFLPCSTFRVCGNGRNPVDVKIADLNKDGNNDVITSNLNGRTLSVLYGEGSREFTSRAQWQIGGSFGGTWGSFSEADQLSGYPTHVDTSDINSDNKLDLLFSITNNNTAVPNGFVEAVSLDTLSLKSCPCSDLVNDLDGQKHRPYCPSFAGTVTCSNNKTPTCPSTYPTPYCQGSVPYCKNSQNSIIEAVSCD